MIWLDNGNKIGDKRAEKVADDLKYNHATKTSDLSDSHISGHLNKKIK